jgi:hypothetical protein
MAAIFGSCLPGGWGGCTWYIVYVRQHGAGVREGPTLNPSPQGCNPCPYWVKMKFTLCTQLFFSPCIFGTTELNIEILTLIHRVNIVPGFLSSRPNWLPPHPQGGVAPTPLGPRGESHSLAGGGGGGVLEPNSDEGTDISGNIKYKY